MLKLAFTIGAYRLTAFIRLGILQLQKLSPDSPILVSDDLSPESGDIQKVAEELGCTYRCSRIRKGHFSADAQSIVNSLVFAEGAECDVAIKVSQRFIFRKPESIDVIQKAFSNPNIMAATPGQPKVTNGSPASGGFGRFGILSDVVMIRVGAMTGEQLLHLYRARLLREKTPWASFIEMLVDELHTAVFPGKTMRLQELTNPTEDPIYLRRYQATEQQYRDLGMTHGFNGLYPCVEWAQIEGANYFSKPKVI